MKLLRYLLSFPAFCFAFNLMAQDADLPQQHEGYHFIDRLDIKGLTGQTVHTESKPYGRKMAAEVFANSDTSNLSLRERQWFHLMRISVDDDYANAQESKGVLKYFFKNGRDFYHYADDKVKLYANVVAHISAGGDQNDYNAGQTMTNLLNYRNSRGVQLRGSVGKMFGFFSEMIENQAKLPQFVRNEHTFLGVLNGQNFVKVFDQGTPNTGFDFFSAKGYLTFSPSKHFRAKFGKDRAFWGNGYQNLLLNDQATDYLFLNLNTKIWKLEYINHFTVMTDFIPNKPDGYGVYPKKYGAMHEILYKPWRQLSVGIFESVVYSPTLPSGQRGFEVEYLNPIIFYRSVEQSLGSPDNSMLGASWKLNFLRRFQHYGQFLLDDLNFRNRGLGKGYAGNKYGSQWGLKYVDAFGVMGLDLQAEYNRVRPYTYSHFNPAASYMHYGQYLGYAFGANASDLNFIVRYQPFPRWSAIAAFTSVKKGLDINGLNYGGDPRKPYTTNFQDYNNTVGQGELLKITQLYGRLSYRVKRLDGFADLEGRYRKENDNTSLSVLGSLRINLPNAMLRY